MSFEVGNKIKVINNKPLRGNDVAPNLILGDELEIKEIIYDSKLNQHLDVGLVSHYNYIRSFETKEELPRGNKIHWCHPSRFEKI
jgi:hypothetical protein